MDRGAWWATVHRVTKSRTRLKQLGTGTGIRLLYYQSNKIVYNNMYHIIFHVLYYIDSS